jgi:hypothetical protein
MTTPNPKQPPKQLPSQPPKPPQPSPKPPPQPIQNQHLTLLQRHTNKAITLLKNRNIRLQRERLERNQRIVQNFDAILRKLPLRS